MKRAIEQHNQGARAMFKGGRMVNGVELVADHTFGINCGPIFGQLQVVGDDRVVFMMGSTIVIKELKDSGEETFISREGRFRNVTALCALPSEKRPHLLLFLGQASTTQDSAVICVFQTERGKLKLLTTPWRFANVGMMVVNPARKELVALFNSKVALFNYERGRLIATCQPKARVQKVSIDPQHQKGKDLHFMGRNFFKVWTAIHQEEAIKQSHESLLSLSIQSQHEFRDHCWAQVFKVCTLMIVAKHLPTNRPRVLLIQNGQLKQILQIDTQQLRHVRKRDKQERQMVGVAGFREDQLHANEEVPLPKISEFTAIAATRRGFLIGGQHRVVVGYQFQQAGQVLGLANSQVYSGSLLQLTEQERIVSLQPSGGEEMIVITTLNQLQSANFFIANTFSIVGEGSHIVPFFKAGFHHKRVNSLSRATTKSVLASCSEDNSVKLWSFYERNGQSKTGLFSAAFQDEPLSISLHPSGLFIAVSFSSCFRIFAVVKQELEVLKQSTQQGCRILRYSQGGHLLFVTEKERILIYDTVYYQVQSMFTLTAAVTDFVLSDDDLFMVAVCSSGYLYCHPIHWKLKDSDPSPLMLFAHHQPQDYTAIAYDSQVGDSDLLLASTTQKYLIILKNRGKNLVAQFPVKDCHVTNLLISRSLKVLFAGTSSGKVRVYLWPLDDANLFWEQCSKTQVRIVPPPCYEMVGHASPITALALSQSGSLLFSGGGDGTLLVSRVVQHSQEQQKKEKGAKDQDKRRIDQTANQIHLERMSRVETKNELINKYKMEVVRSQQRLKLQREKLDLMTRQNIENMKKEFVQALESERRIKDSYVESNEREYQALVQEIKTERDKYRKDIDQFKAANKKKVLYEEGRNQVLQKQIEALRGKHRTDLQIMNEQHAKHLRQVKKDYFARCQKLEVKYSNVVIASQMNASTYVKELDEIEATYEQQIEKQIQAKNEEIQKVTEMNERLNQRNKELKKTYDELKADDQRLQREFEEKFKEHNSIRFENLKNDQDILKMQHQLLERLQVIDSKQQTCKNARYEQATLQNFRYILDSKIESLEQKKQAILASIDEKEGDLRRMITELTRQSQENEGRTRELKDLHSRIKVSEHQLQQTKLEHTRNLRQISYIQGQLAKLVEMGDDTKLMAQRLRALIEGEGQAEEHAGQGQRNDKRSHQQAALVSDQLQRQNKWVTKKLQVVRLISQKQREIRQSNINSVIVQNIKLIEECTRLRDENDKLTSQISKLEKNLDEFQRKKRHREMKDRKPQVDMGRLDQRIREQATRVAEQRQALASMQQRLGLDLRKPEEQSRILKDLD